MAVILKLLNLRTFKWRRQLTSAASILYIYIITLKDHKDNFTNNTNANLPNLGSVSKKILEKLISTTKLRGQFMKEHHRSIKIVQRIERPKKGPISIVRHTGILPIDYSITSRSCIKIRRCDGKHPWRRARDYQTQQEIPPNL